MAVNLPLSKSIQLSVGIMLRKEGGRENCYAITTSGKPFVDFAPQTVAELQLDSIKPNFEAKAFKSLGQRLSEFRAVL